MSPYRVLVKTVDGVSKIFAAVLYVNQTEHAYGVSIIERKLPADFSVAATPKIIAHLQNTKSNSIVVARYGIEKAAVGGRAGYSVIRRPKKITLEEVQFTLSDCLSYAMSDYCNQNSLEHISAL